MILVRHADQRALSSAALLERFVKPGKPFVRPRRQSSRCVLDEKVRVLVKDNAEGALFGGGVDGDEIAIGPARKKPGERNGLPFERGFVRRERRIALKDEHDGRNRVVDCGRGKDARQHIAKLLEMQGDITNVAFGRVADKHKVIGAQPRPSRLGRLSATSTGRRAQ